MKTLIFTDIHIHPHKKSVERLDDCIRVLDWVFETVVAKKIKHIVFLGDLFHDRQKIDVLTYQKTFEVLEKYLLKNDLKFFILLGNHDLWHDQKWDVSSVNPLRTLPGVKIINEPSVISLTDDDDNLFGFLPYTHNPIKDLKSLEKKWSKFKNKKRILGAHIAVDGSVWNLKYNTISEVSIEHDGEMVKVDKDVFKKWEKVFLGHYHAEQKLADNVEYVGSPLQLSFGEAFQKKHILIYDLKKDTSEYIENDFSPKHFIIKEDEIDDYDLEGNFVRLEVEDMTSSSVMEVRKKLIKENKVSSIQIKQSVKKEEHVIEDAKVILQKEDEMIEKYIEQVKTDLEKTKLISIGKSICN